MLLPTFRNKYVVAWPHEDERQPPRISTMSTSALFERVHHSDVHFAAYHSSVPCRIKNEAAGKTNWFMVAFVVDVDLPETIKTRIKRAEQHKIEDPHIKDEISAWFELEKPKIQRVLETTPVGVAYRSKSGGYRLIWWYRNPLQIASSHDLELWAEFYIRQTIALFLRFGIVADPNCNDAAHIFRAPRVRLDNGTYTAGKLLWPINNTQSIDEKTFEPSDEELEAGIAQLSKFSNAWRVKLRRLFPPPETAQPNPPLPNPNHSPRNTGHAPGYIRAVAYARSRPPSIQGADGNNPFWMTAVTLTKCFGLSEAEAVEVIMQHFNPRCKPPWSQREIERAVRNAAQSNFTPRLWHESYHVSMIALISQTSAERHRFALVFFVC